LKKYSVIETKSPQVTIFSNLKELFKRSVSDDTTAYNITLRSREDSFKSLGFKEVYLLSAHTCHLNLHLLVTSSPVNECNDNFFAAACARYFHSHSSNREISRCRRRITRNALARFESKLDNLYLLFTGSFVSCVHIYCCEYVRRYFLMKYFRRTEISYAC